MSRVPAAAAAAIVALGLLAGLAIWRFGGSELRLAPAPQDGAAPSATGPGEPLPSRPATGAAAPAAAPAAPAPAAAPAEPAPRPAWRDPMRLPPPVPEGTPWSDVPLATRVAALGALAPKLDEMLQRARGEMDPCFEGPEVLNPRPPAGARGPAVLTLHLEAKADRLEVVDAPLDRPGTSSGSLVACCQAALRGASVAVPGLEPGLRYRYQLVLIR